MSIDSCSPQLRAYTISFAFLFIACAVFLQTGLALSATKIGVTSAVNPKAVGIAPGRAARTLFIGKNVVFNERIKTTEGGLVQLLFVDGTAFTVGENSELVIDKFIYNPKKKTGKMVVNVVKGVFRFVGGRLSKAKGGVILKTSVATIGIRGGVMTGKVGAQGKSTFSFLFGDQMVVGTGCSGEGVASCSNVKRAFQNGNSIDVGAQGGLNLRRTTGTDVASVNKSLAGARGKKGGSKSSPGETAVVQANIGTSNSANKPSQIAPPPKNAVRSTTIVQVETVLIQPELATGDENRDEAGGTPQVFPAFNIRALSNGETYTIPQLGNRVVADAGRFGFVGADGIDNDELLFANIANGRLDVQTDDNGIAKTISIPFSPGRNVINAGDITETFPNGTAGFIASAGRVFVADDFSFFFLEVNEPSDQPGVTKDLTIAFGGVKTQSANLPTDDALRVYTLSPDFVQNSVVPLTLFNAVPNLANTTVTPLLMRVQTGGIFGQYPNAASSRTVILQSNLLIDGQGGAQRSYTLLQAATVVDNGNGPDLAYSLRGSLRQAANKGAAVLTGAVDGLNGFEGNALFGPTGEYFVIGNDPKPVREASSIIFKDGFNTAINLATDVYATTQLAELDKTISAVNLPVAQTTRTLVGFAGGLQESNAGSSFPNIFQSVDTPTAVNLEFDAARNTLIADFRLEDVNNSDFVNFYTFGFGSDAGNPNGGQSAFIDDDRFGAQHDRADTRITFDDTTTAAFPNQIGQNNPNTYFFGNELVPTTGFVPGGVNICACKFLEWGYWGGRLRYQDPQASPGNAREDYFHLATWVAGNPTANLPNTGSATFAGHVIGNVAQTVGGQVEQFIAAGSYQQTWDFGSRTGTAQITNFAGRSFGSTNLTTPINPGDFSGPVNGALTGQIAGSFVSSTSVPVAGVIGKFRVEDPGDRTLFTAQGIIAAETTSITGGGL